MRPRRLLTRPDSADRWHRVRANCTNPCTTTAPRALTTWRSGPESEVDSVGPQHDLCHQLRPARTS